MFGIKYVHYKADRYNQPHDVYSYILAETCSWFCLRNKLCAQAEYVKFLETEIFNKSLLELSKLNTGKIQNKLIPVICIVNTLYRKLLQ